VRQPRQGRLQSDYRVAILGEKAHARGKGLRAHEQAGTEAMLIPQRGAVVAEDAEVARRQSARQGKKAGQLSYAQDQKKQPPLHRPYPAKHAPRPPGSQSSTILLLSACCRRRTGVKLGAVCISASSWALCLQSFRRIKRGEAA